MTTATDTHCAGSTTCKRPATWMVSDSYGRLYLTSATRYTREPYCKAHAEQRIRVLRAEMPDDERERLYRQDTARRTARYELETIVTAWSDAILAARTLERGNGWQNGNSAVPDPEHAAVLMAALAPLAAPIEAFAAQMRTIRDAQS